ncbi:MAG: glycosyltransferase family 39 protein [Deltaproteobacteria bacterium]|nr:glycosyltransferase family 39 protein [Deltaproteobacteria bacterium]
MSRLQVAGAAALLLLSIGVFASRCVTNPAIPFLVQDAEAPWIMFPLPPTGLMGLASRDAPPVTTFRRSFDAPASGGPRAELRVRAMRACQLWLNGAPIAPPGAAARHWREYRSLDLAAGLRPGANELRVEVINPTGPAMLSLRLEGLPQPLVSDGSWTASVDDGRPEQAIFADSERVNPNTYVMPSPLEGLAARRNTVLVAFVLSALLFLGARSEAGRRWSPRLARALPLLLALAWTALFATTMLKIPLDVGFDAHHHVDYIDFLRERHTLPLASDGWSMFHPPVYYAPTAALVELQAALAPSSESLLAWKLPGWLAGLGSTLLCWALARRLFGASTREAAFAGLFAATLPMNLYISSYVTNESLHATLASGVALATVALLLAARPTLKGLLAWAAVVSLAVLTKYTAWIVAAVAGFFLLAGWIRVEKAPPARIAKRLALLAGVVLALAGWFYIRNVIHFGQAFPLNVDLPGQTQQWWSQPGYYTPAFFLRFGAVLAHPYLAGFHAAWDSFYSTLWGDGQLAGQIVARARHPYWDYELMAAGYWLALPATAFLALGAARSLRLAFRDPDAGHRAAHSFLLTLAYTLLLSVLYMTLRQPDYGQAKAFYALAAIAPLSVFFALGCGAADAWLEARGASWARALLYGWLGTFSTVLLLSYAG